jgi:hypothetical protein
MNIVLSLASLVCLAFLEVTIRYYSKKLSKNLKFVCWYSNLISYGTKYTNKTLIKEFTLCCLLSLPFAYVLSRPINNLAPDLLGSMGFALYFLTILLMCLQGSTIIAGIPR